MPFFSAAIRLFSSILWILCGKKGKPLLFFRHRKKQKQLRKFLADLKRLLRKRYGRSRYYTKGQVERTIEQEKLDRKFLWHGYQCFVDDAIINQVILEDHPIDMDSVLSDICEAFSIDADEAGSDAVHETIDDWHSSHLHHGFDGDFDSGFDAGSDGGFGDAGDGD